MDPRRSIFRAEDAASDDRPAFGLDDFGEQGGDGAHPYDDTDSRTHIDRPRPSGNDPRVRDVRDGTGAARRKPRLQFTADDAAASDPAPTISNAAKAAKRRSDKAGAQLEQAQNALPKKHSLGVVRSFDEDRGKTRRRLVFEEEVKGQKQHLKGSPLARPGRAVAGAAVGVVHRKLYEAEQENVGTEAAHRGELATEERLRSTYRRRKLAPYRRVRRLEKKAARLRTQTSLREALGGKPRLRGNALSRMAQRRRIRRTYAKAAREARVAGVRAGKAAAVTQKVAAKVAAAVGRHPVAFAVAGLVALLLVYLMGTATSCGSMALSGMGAVAATSYLAPDSDIDASELSYTEWECDLQIEIGRSEQTHPGYDEYRYSIGDIGHGPHELMSYLTARYQDFSFSAIASDLRTVFDQQYRLSYTEVIEVRTRTVWRTDPDTGEDYEEVEEYEWHILNVSLATASFTDVVASRMDVAQVGHYSLLARIKGNRQYTDAPFDFNWLLCVSDGYGWRLHPTTGQKELHRGVDIAVAAGTEIIAAHDGTVTSAGSNGGYGLVVVLAGEGGIETRYAHCSELLVSRGQGVATGDVIARVGTTGDSTGPHLHFEVLKDGQYLNPLYFATTNDDGSSFIPPGMPGGVNIPAYPGAPMDDARYASMMAEAQRHLGKPYVFGAAGPDSFDCSGFVSYVLAHSTHPGFGRTTAWGLYNICTPVSRANARPGDLIFFTETYNAGVPTSHIGIYIGNGQMIHAGDPVQYTSIDTPYWTQHFYAFGRLS
jgi:murein DD-endopeptidase MepM/ murein hydrolase activator NlpD